MGYKVTETPEIGIEISEPTSRATTANSLDISREIAQTK
jgi:hypothetical protein